MPPYSFRSKGVAMWLTARNCVQRTETTAKQARVYHNGREASPRTERQEAKSKEATATTMMIAFGPS